MSDVRIERVEPCSHDIAKGHRIAGEMLWCDGEDRSVLSGFPPEAVEAAKESIYNQNLAAEILLPNGASEGFVGLTELECELIAETALAAAWDALIGGSDGSS